TRASTSRPVSSVPSGWRTLGPRSTSRLTSLGPNGHGGISAHSPSSSRADAHHSFHVAPDGGAGGIPRSAANAGKRNPSAVLATSGTSLHRNGASRPVPASTASEAQATRRAFIVPRRAARAGRARGAAG